MVPQCFNLKISIAVTLALLQGAALQATVYGLKSQASSNSMPPTYLYRFSEDRTGLTVIGQVKIGTASIDADGLAVSSLGLFAFRLTAEGSTLLKVDETTGAATPVGRLLAGRGIRGALFDQRGRLLVVDARNDQLLEIDPATGSVLGSPLLLTRDGTRFDVHTISDIAQRADGVFFFINGRQIFRLNPVSGSLTLLFWDEIASGGTPYISHAGAAFSVSAGENELFVYDINGTDDIFRYDVTVGPASRRLMYANLVSAFNAGRGDLASMPSSFRASVPVADAGPDRVGQPGEAVTLDGSGSFDADGDYPLKYEWTILERPEGSLAALDAPASPMTAFVPDLKGSYTIELVVTDSLGQRSAPDEVLVSTSNVPPVANAGADQAILLVGTTVQLDGSGSSDADGDPLTYQWTMLSQPDGSMAEISDTSLSNPTFVPDVYGDYVASLTVTDGAGAASEDLVTISFQNLAPVARAESEGGTVVTLGDRVQLDGSGSSDPNGDPLTYHWSFVLKPEGSSATFAAPDEALTSFPADLPGEYIVSLVVHDGRLESKPSNVALRVNAPPVADAGPDRELFVPNTTVRLDASGSHDPDGDLLSYRWTFLARPMGSSAEISESSVPDPTLLPDRYGDYVLRLVVTDAFGAEDEDVVTLHLVNLPPVAHVEAVREAVVGDRVNLNGGGSSDPNGDSLIYAWTLTTRPEGSAASLDGASTAEATFKPDQPGEYRVRLVVHDGLLASGPLDVRMTVLSIQNAAERELTDLGELIQQLGPAVFKHGNSKSTLASKLNAVLRQIEEGAYAEALAKLDGDLLQKTDGCARSGAPDSNDWITDCATQQQIYPVVVYAIDLLRRLL